MEKVKNLLRECTFEELLRDFCKADGVFMYNGFVYIWRGKKIRQLALSVKGDCYQLVEYSKCERLPLQISFSEFVEDFSDVFYPVKSHKLSFPVGKFLEEARIRSGLSRTEAAKSVGIKVRDMRYLETDTCSPPLVEFFSLCRLYGVSEDEMYKLFSDGVHPAEKGEEQQ